MSYYQQGDCLWKEVATIPKEAKKQKSDLAWKGANHHHRVKGKFQLFKTKNAVYLDSKGCTLFHEEHQDIKVKSGKYMLEIVIEYDHLTEEARQVID